MVVEIAGRVNSTLDEIFFWLTLRSVSAVAAGFWRGLRGRGDSAGMADTLLLD